MQSLTLLLIPLTLLASCAPSSSSRNNDQIQKLEQEVTTLKLENANLHEENVLLKAGGDPSTIQNQTETRTGTYISNGTTYEEGSLTLCLKQSHDDYISAGTRVCKKDGYSDADILANKCQLTTKVIQELTNNESNAEASCRSLYQ